MTTALFAYDRAVERTPRLFTQIQAQLALRFGNIESVVASSPADLSKRTKTLKKIAVAIAAGGDGLLRDLVNLFAHRDLQEKDTSDEKRESDKRANLEPVTFGVIPLGSGNETARGLKIPLDARKAVQLIGGKTITIYPGSLTILDGSVAADICRDIYPSGQPLLFVNSAGTGIDSATVKARQRLARFGLHSYLTNFLVGVLPGLRPFHARVSGDRDRDYEGDTCWVVGFRGPYLGGGILWAPTAHPRRAELQVMIVKGASRLRIIRELPRVLRGRAPESALLRFVSGTHFRVYFRRQRPISIDGDILAVAREIEVAIGPPLRIFAPDGE